jgi:dTDP-4-dehydrorhamnose 3,5-epimerase
MPIRFLETDLPGVVIVEPDLFRDERGFFLETYHQKRYAEGGIDCLFVQDNHSHSRQGTLRGLHYQLKQSQAKLIYVSRGEIFDVAVDIRRGSPTFGKWAGERLTGENGRQMYIPMGFAHGFFTLSETADVIYKCADFYAPGDEYGILWSDPDIGIDWPDKNPLLSKKDSRNPRLSDVPEDLLPLY